MVALELGQDLLFENAARDVPVRVELEVAHLANEQRGFGLDRGADHDPHLERRLIAARLIADIAQRPQAVSRQVDHDQWAGTEIRQPAQALERQFELAHALPGGHIERVDGTAAQHAILVQPVTGLEVQDALFHLLAVDSLGRGRRIGRQVAQQHQALEQRLRGRVGAAGRDLGTRFR
jgi:hypothetical protein